VANVLLDSCRGFDLKPRRQIGHPLWRCIDQRGFNRFVKAGEHEHTQRNEDKAQRKLRHLSRRQQPAAPTRHRFPRQRAEQQQRHCGTNAEAEHRDGDLRHISPPPAPPAAKLRRAWVRRTDSTPRPTTCLYRIGRVIRRHATILSAGPPDSRADRRHPPAAPEVAEAPAQYRCRLSVLRRYTETGQHRGRSNSRLLRRTVQPRRTTARARGRVPSHPIDSPKLRR
jgi:hypothetical protein